MITIKNYMIATDLEQAYETLTANKKNIIIGGMLWLKMGKQNVNTAIDLSGLGLNQIVETEDSIEIGCMTTLRQLETSEVLQAHFNGVIGESVKHIVGTQFRNTATVGGSIFARFGFSDILTALLALDTSVCLHHGGTMPLEQFIELGREKDILVKLIVRKDGRKASYKSQRNAATDFPTLAVCVSSGAEGVKIAVGARPCKAKLAYKAQALLQGEMTETTIGQASEMVAEELGFGTNLRASKAYRQQLAKVLVQRAIEDIRE